MARTPLAHRPVLEKDFGKRQDDLAPRPLLRASLGNHQGLEGWVICNHQQVLVLAEPRVERLQDGDEMGPAGGLLQRRQDVAGERNAPDSRSSLDGEAPTLSGRS